MHINAREELISLLKGGPALLCATIYNETHDSLNNISLKVDYSGEDYSIFLERLNFEYDNGYGIQQLFGILWFCDGTWATRGEYDGSEWWQIYSMPAIPKELL